MYAKNKFSRLLNISITDLERKDPDNKLHSFIVYRKIAPIKIYTGLKIVIRFVLYSF